VDTTPQSQYSKSNQTLLFEVKCKDQLRPAEEAAGSIEILTLKITMEGNLEQ